MALVPPTSLKIDEFLRRPLLIDENLTLAHLLQPKMVPDTRKPKQKNFLPGELWFTFFPNSV